MEGHFGRYHAKFSGAATHLRLQVAQAQE